MPLITGLERAVRMAPRRRAEHFRAQAQGLQVVGRCGCERCLIIFFEQHVQGELEADLASRQGNDHPGWLAAVFEVRFAEYLQRRRLCSFWCWAPTAISSYRRHNRLFDTGA